MAIANDFNVLPSELSDIPVIVLCGGAATRMAEVTGNAVPKHLLMAGGRTVLEHAIEPFMGAGQIILATGMHGDQISEFVSERYDCDKVVCSPEERPLGVIGAIAQAIGRFGIHERFIIAHGDEITPDLNLPDMFYDHRAAPHDITVLATTRQPAIKDFAFTMDSDGTAHGFKRQAEAEADPAATNFGIGTFVCEQSVVAPMIEHDAWGEFLQQMIGEQRLLVHAVPVQFWNINRPSDFADLDTIRAVS